jgi:hypothetical protein
MKSEKIITKIIVVQGPTTSGPPQGTAEKGGSQFSSLILHGGAPLGEAAVVATVIIEVICSYYILLIRFFFSSLQTPFL